MKINQTNASYPKEKNLIQLIEEQIQKKPQSIAIECQGRVLTFQDLNEQANQLAHYLILSGVKPGKFIGVFFERSVELLVGLLAVVKTGASFVPLDPSYPKDRIQYIIEDSNMDSILVHEPSMAFLHLTSVSVINVDREKEKISQSSIKNPVFAIPLKSSEILYTIYTSGSTGRPKGICITHASLINTLFHMIKECSIDNRETIAAVIPISFDISMIDVFAALLSGAKIGLVTKEDSQDGKVLLELLVKMKATFMQATPVTWRLLLSAGWTTDYKLKIISGGEALETDLAKELFVRSSGFWNFYGPTETTVYSTGYRVPSVADIYSNGKLVPIGIPISNTQIYILSESMEMLPFDQPGELYIGGDGLSSGYLGREDLTSQVFIQNPFNRNERIYKTGDVVSLSSDGLINFLGRSDHQIKIRGFRIELSEINFVLKEVTGLKETIVSAKEFGSGDKRLVVYYVSDDGSHLNIKDVREQLAKKLPDYMIPSYFTKMESFPLTPNKKIDYNALPLPKSTGTNLKHDFVVFKTLTEEKLIKIWCDAFKLDSIGIEENFFSLGGNSIIATNIVFLIQDKLAINMFVKDIFDYPTIDRLAVLIEKRHSNFQTKEKSDSLVLNIQKKDLIPLSFEQLGFWLFWKFSKQTYNISDVFIIDGELNYHHFQNAINELIMKHEAIWYSFSNKIPMQKKTLIKPYAVRIIDLIDLDKDNFKEQWLQLVEKELHGNFNFSETPLIRLVLAKITEKQHQLFISLPHSICDASALTQFVANLFETYQNQLDGTYYYSNTAKKRLVDEICIERSSDHISIFQKDVEYWKKKLKGAELLRLPKTSFLTGEKPTGKKVFEIATIPEELLKKINQICSDNSCSFGMGMLSISISLMYSMTKSHDITFLMSTMKPVASKEQSIRNSASMFPIRTQINPDYSFQQLMLQVRESVLESLDHLNCPAIIPYNNALRANLVGWKGWFYKMLATIIGGSMHLRWKSAWLCPENMKDYLTATFASLPAFLNGKETRALLPPFVNILPRFYGDDEIKKQGNISVSSIGDYELVVPFKVFEGNGDNAESAMPTFCLTRNENKEAVLYIYGGRLKQEVLSDIMQSFSRILTQVTNNPEVKLHDI
ncbi:MAG: amino acid adenylation domain-containing protein [Bacteroidales bacterium]|nr:amino acid adenylation domain-containing protein [Bacteroidales bacterium]